MSKNIMLDLKTIDLFNVEQENLKEERAIIHYISTNSKDRGGDVVNPHGLDDSDFNKGRTVLFNHKMDMPVARNLWLKQQDNGVLAKTVFGSTTFANDIYQLHLEKILNSWSIGFMIPDEKDAMTYDKTTDTYFINKWAMHEYSTVSVPMNSDCIDVAKGIVKSLSAKQILSEMEFQHEFKKQLSEYEEKINSLVEEINIYKEEAKILNAGLEEFKSVIEEIKNKIEPKAIENVAKKEISDEQLQKIFKEVFSGAFSRVMGRD